MSKPRITFSFDGWPTYAAWTVWLRVDGRLVGAIQGGSPGAALRRMCGMPMFHKYFPQKVHQQ